MAEKNLKTLTQDILRNWSAQRIQKEFPQLTEQQIEKLKRIATAEPDVQEVSERE